MPVLRQHRIYRSDLKNNPTVMYLFGDNAQREGLGGQAGEMRFEHNAVGVRTKKSPSMDAAAFFNDDEVEANLAMIREDLNPVLLHLQNGGIVVIPSDGLGTGLSELPKRAPLTAARLDEMLNFFITAYPTA
jgi:hypothetical protein